MTPSPTPTPSVTPTPLPSLVSPCPHTPECPPPACLPPSLRQPSAPATPSKPANNSGQRDDSSGGKSDLPGYEVELGYITGMAGAMAASSENMHGLKQSVPRLGEWHGPLTGIPLIAQPYVGRFNNIAEIWSDTAGIMGTVLSNDSDKVHKSVENYRAANQPGGKN
ncbi:hypothetical protein [Nonomuraea basaltis]|uniref:hypothetical protein n=1 Tax=Nonomuraea basaltis TaxID=2495887 RepID=UPI00110C6EEE|nr:hypothetical protein [Nonomuraea basaltis]TMR96938.1 hypothetical protein EJK15_20360 [Nonomuraea basaltis]